MSAQDKIEGPNLSIVIPCFNVGAKIKRAVNSCLRFSSLSVEVIIVDDASSDNTLHFLNDYRNDGRVRIVELKKNQGASNARNCGKSLATGSYLGFLDADDYYLENACTDIANAIANRPDVEVYCFGYLINGKQSPLPRSTVLHTEFIRRKFSNTNTIVSRRAAIHGIDFDTNYHVGEDTLFWFTLLLTRRSAYFKNSIAFYDYDPKLNWVVEHPLLAVDLVRMGVEENEAREIRMLLKKNINMKRAFARSDSIFKTFKKTGLRGVIFWIAGPEYFRIFWTLKSKFKK